MHHGKHIIWDWNGTLLDDSRALISSVIAAFTMTKLGNITLEDSRRAFMRPISDFFDKLANRRLTANEQRRLMEQFENAYRKFSCDIELTADAMAAMETWTRYGGTQSLLSMCPHDVLVCRLNEERLLEQFIRVDGFRGHGPDTKASHLKEHLKKLANVKPTSVTLVGDTVDDVLAARAVGIDCVAYHSGDYSLHSLDHFDQLDVRVERTLLNVVKHLLRMKIAPYS